MENNRYFYLAALTTKFYGVGDEINQDLGQPALVTQNVLAIKVLGPVGGLDK